MRPHQKACRSHGSLAATICAGMEQTRSPMPLLILCKDCLTKHTPYHSKIPARFAATCPENVMILSNARKTSQVPDQQDSHLLEDQVIPPRSVPAGRGHQPPPQLTPQDPTRPSCEGGGACPSCWGLAGCLRMTLSSAEMMVD